MTSKEQRYPQCVGCEWRERGIGFVPDFVPATPRVAFVLEAPGEWEVVHGAPMTGKAGQYWERFLLAPVGLKRSECLIANTLRCRPPDNIYPTGDVRKKAEKACRRHDSALEEYDPDWFVVTVHPASLLRTPVMLRLVRRDIALAAQASARGRRPLVIMGDKAMGVFAPWLDGGVTRWRGHWWEGSLATKEVRR